MWGQESRHSGPEPSSSLPCRARTRGSGVGGDSPQEPQLSLSKTQAARHTHPIPAGPGLRPWGTPAPFVLR